MAAANDGVDTSQSAADSTTTTIGQSDPGGSTGLSGAASPDTMLGNRDKGELCDPAEKCSQDQTSLVAGKSLVTNGQQQYWALCPASQSVLLRAANTMGINFMVHSTTIIQSHEAYQEILRRIRRYKMNLVIELPKEDRKEAGGRMMKTFARLQTYIEAANKVFIIAPRTNPYWVHWETLFVGQGIQKGHTQLVRHGYYGFRHQQTIGASDLHINQY